MLGGGDRRIVVRVQPHQKKLATDYSYFFFFKLRSRTASSLRVRRDEKKIIARKYDKNHLVYDLGKWFPAVLRSAGLFYSYPRLSFYTFWCKLNLPPLAFSKFSCEVAQAKAGEIHLPSRIKKNFTWLYRYDSGEWYYCKMIRLVFRSVWQYRWSAPFVSV